MQPFPRLHGYIIPRNNREFKSSVKNKSSSTGTGKTIILIKSIDTPPPQKLAKGRCRQYTVCSTPDTNIHTFYNGVVLFPNSALQP